MRSNQIAYWILAVILVALSNTYGSELKDGWTIRSEMRLPPAPQGSRPAIKTIARFDFEKGQEGWYSRHPDVKIEHSAAAGIEGKGGLFVRGREPSNWNFVASPTLAIEPGKKYCASMWVRIESRPEGNRPVYFKIEFIHNDDKSSDRVSSTTVPSDKLHEWCRIEAEFQAPTNSHSLWAALEKGTDSPATIDASIDDFVLEEIADFSNEITRETGELVGPITTTLAKVHPRIYLTAQMVTNLRTEIQTDPRWKWAKNTLFWLADRGIEAGPPDYDKEVEKAQKAGGHGADEQLWQRPVGNMIPNLALAYLLSGDTKYLNAAKQWVFASLSYKTWGLGSADGMDLATGHQLAGIGLAYDWLYNDLSAEERALIRQGVQKRAGAMARAALKHDIWWEHCYMQNHLWVNAAGLATAGFAMCDEVDEARAWIRLAHEKFLTTLATAGDDGASHEGYGYWEYGAEYVMRYMEMAHDLLGIDLYKSGEANHPWLEQSPLYALYLALPSGTWTHEQSVIDIGDNPRCNWYGPSYLLHNLARRYPASPYAGVAQWFAAQTESARIDATASGHYLNFVWYNPDLPQTSPQALPTLHHFENLGIVSARTDWSGTGSVFVVKCGPPLGHRQIHAPYDYGAGHAHPDAGHFVFFSGGQFLFRDDGYSFMKMTGNHSTILVDGKGQKGEGKTWFDYAPWLLDQRAPRIVSVSPSRDVDVIVCDVAPAYPPDLGLKKFIRTFRFHKKLLRLEVQDELEAERPVIFESRFQVEGALEKISETDYRLTQKNVIAHLVINEGAQANADIRKNESGAFLWLTSKEKQLKARFSVVISVEDQATKKSLGR